MAERLRKSFLAKDFKHAIDIYSELITKNHTDPSFYYGRAYAKRWAWHIDEKCEADIR